MTLDARADRTALRLKLYEGGFSPLANKSKLCLTREWSTIKVTPDLIRSREWARSKSFMDTGIRCGDVVALDWDIDDKALLNDLLDAVIATGLVEESPFVRIGRPPRELWVYRTSEKIGKRTTGHFSAPDAPEDESGYAVEILGAGCQFAAYGQRDADTAYQWPVQSLVDAEYMDLPVITKAQVDALKDFCEIFLAARGLVRRSPAGGTDAGYTHAYDLTPEMQFEVKDLGVLGVNELAEVLHANPEEVLRCRVDAFRPTSGSWAGMASLVNGEVCISDHGTYTSHFLATSDLSASMERLGALLAERFPEVEPVASDLADRIDMTSVMAPRQSMDVNLAIAFKRYVYLTDTDLIADVTAPTVTMRPEHFRNLMRPYFRDAPGPRGGAGIERLFDLWMDSHDRLNVSTVGLRPDRPWPLYEEGGKLHLNTYTKVVLPTHGDAEPGFEFLRNLLPVESERVFFTQWLSYKYQHPDVRGPGVIMVANDTYGTGRGSLLSLIRTMFAPGMVRNVDFKTLSGQTYQSQYNAWLAESLIVAVDEAQETMHGATRWQTRNNAYEHLKSIIDPANHDFEVINKGVKNGAGKTFASVLVFTNHADSVVLPQADRRLAILENGQAMPQSYWDAFHRWRAKPENVGAFVAALERVDLADYNPYVAPPMTAAKADMIDAGVSDIDRASALVLARLPGTLLTKSQFHLLLEATVIAEGFDFPEDWERVADRIYLKKTRRLIGNDRVRIDGKPFTLRMVRPCPLEVLQSEALMLEEVLRNGPVVRAMRTGNIVAFPVAR